MMTVKRHEIPTHLTVEDKAFYGLSARQVMYLTVGFSSAYGLWTGWPELAVGLKLVGVIVCLLAAVVMALVRPYGRGLEDWLFVALRYLAIPKTSLWRPRLPHPRDRGLGEGRWEDLTPTVAWGEEQP